MSIHTDNVDEDGIVEDVTVETYYRAAEHIEVGDGYLRVFMDDGGTDIETRVPFEALRKLGWKQAKK